MHPAQPISELVEGDGAVLHVNDRKLVGALKVRLRFGGGGGEAMDGG